jgi:hypothetical protein
MPIEIVVVPMVFLLVMLIIVLATMERWRRERHRVELQKAVLERVGSVKDFAEFMATEQGERFLAALAPMHFRPHHRGLWSVRVGVVLLTVGVLLMIGFHTVPGATTDAPLVMLLLLLIALGLGMLLSALLSFLIARSLGVNGRGKSKNDAV